MIPTVTACRSAPDGEGRPRVGKPGEPGGLRLPADGRSLTGIAETLGIAYKTVANQCTRIKEKLGLDRTADLIRFALENRGASRVGEPEARPVAAGSRMTDETDLRRRADVAQKARALRKYEAGAVPVASDAGDPPLEMLSPFGPLIGRTRVPSALLARLDAFADRHVAAGEREFLVPPEVACAGGTGSLVAVLDDRLRRFVLSAEGEAARGIEIDRIWVVSQGAETPSPVHFHSGDLSGVLYLKAPEPPAEAELGKTYISGRKAGYLNFLIGGKQRFAKTLLSVAPEVGVLYVFPAWLLHGVEPFAGAGERRSLSFNARAETDG